MLEITIETKEQASDAMEAVILWLREQGKTVSEKTVRDWAAALLYARDVETLSGCPLCQG